jgi:threonine dehydrogenase-like Zn-dependent dehydrogenase
VQRMLTSRRIHIDGLVTDTVALKDAGAMFQLLRKPNDHCKVLITP